MEPRFMGQLPELMKNYKAEETEIIAGLQEKLQEVFQKAQQMQKVDRKGKICTMGVSYLQSSVLTGSYDLRIDLYDKEFYLDSAECCTYWKPAFITEYIQKDIKYFKYNIHGKVPQIRTYEIQEFMDGYIINYLYLLAQFLEQIMPQILCKVRPAFREVMDDGMHVIFGEYMGKGMIIVGETEELSIICSTGRKREIRCRGSETGWRDWIIRQFKKENWRSYRSEPFFFWKKIRIHYFLM